MGSRRSSSRSREPSAAGRSAGVERLFGLHSVLEALKARRRRFVRLLIRRGTLGRSEIEAIVRLAADLGVPLLEVGERQLRGDGLEGNPQGVVLEAGSLPELGLDALFGSRGGPCRIVALDGVEDPQNVGAVVRVAEASGVRGLILTRRRAPPLSPAVARASAGAIEWLPVARVSNLPRAIEDLKARGFWVVGAEPGAVDSLFEIPDRVLRGSLLVVLGAEGRGIRPGVRRLVDHPVHIPMRGRVGSLNVSVAGAVLLFDLMRRSSDSP